MTSQTDTSAKLLSERILKAYKESGIKQKYVIEQRAGLSKGLLSRLTNPESEYGTPSVDRLARLARVLGVRFEWLASGVGAMRDPGQVPEGDEAKSSPAAKPDEVVTERDDRYPNRVLAVKIARSYGHKEAAIQKIVSKKLKRDSDLPVDEWLESIRHYEREMERFEEPRTLDPADLEEEGSTGDILKDAEARLAKAGMR